MLVLTRKKRESIAVGRRDGGEPMLTVTVLEIGSGRVRLGFQGDPDISIHRWELWERIRPRSSQTSHRTRRPRQLTTAEDSIAAPLVRHSVKGNCMGLLLLIIVIVLLLGGLPTWNHSRNWGYGPSGLLGLVVLVLLVMMLLGHIPRGF